MAESANITIAGLAQRWAVSERQVRYLVERGELDVLRFGSAVRIGLRSVNAYERENTKRATAGPAAA